MSTNRLSITITDAQKQEIGTATTNLVNATKNLNIVIDKETVKSLPKVADGRIPFVQKTAEYAISNPEFLPPHTNVPEFQIDLKAYLDLREVVRPLEQIFNNLRNSMMVSGSEAYDAARDYYKTVKFHAGMGTPGAQTIYEDLKQLFEAKSTPEPDK